MACDNTTLATLNEPPACGVPQHNWLKSLYSALCTLIPNGGTGGGTIFPTGTYLPFGGNIAPAGFLLCYGQAVSRVTYAGLFAVIGTNFGAGDGSTTFNVPDMRGRAPIGRDNMGGTPANRVTDIQADNKGGFGGSETQALTVAQLPSHNHNLNGGVGTVVVYNTPGASNLTPTAGAVSPSTTSPITSNTGSGQAHNNMQPWYADDWIIKT